MGKEVSVILFCSAIFMWSWVLKQEPGAFLEGISYEKKETRWFLKFLLAQHTEIPLSSQQGSPTIENYQVQQCTSKRHCNFQTTRGQMPVTVNSYYCQMNCAGAPLNFYKKVWKGQTVGKRSLNYLAVGGYSLVRGVPWFSILPSVSISR